MSVVGSADRVTVDQARRAFEGGASVLVSADGLRSEVLVSVDTVMHRNTRTDWDALVADVRAWRGRYPDQRFYVVTMHCVGSVGFGAECGDLAHEVRDGYPLCDTHAQRWDAADQAASVV